jgi:hypothetical protein
MTDAEKVAAKLAGKLKKFTITIAFKNGTQLELQSDKKLKTVFDSDTRQVLVHDDDYNENFSCRWADVLYINHVNNKE